MIQIFKYLKSNIFPFYYGSDKGSIHCCQDFIKKKKKIRSCFFKRIQAHLVKEKFDIGRGEQRQFGYDFVHIHLAMVRASQKMPEYQ